MAAGSIADTVSEWMACFRLGESSVSRDHAPPPVAYVRTVRYGMSFTPSRASHCLLDSKTRLHLNPTNSLPQSQRSTQVEHLPSPFFNSQFHTKSAISKSLQTARCVYPSSSSSASLASSSTGHNCTIPTSMAACIIISSYLDVC